MSGFDHVIIGGGSAGSTLAARLSERGDRTVLLLEAGASGPLGTPEDTLANVSFALTARDWGMRACVDGSRELDYPQGRFVGGGSSVNGGLAFRGTPADYDGWAGGGNPSWSWDQMLPCFRRLERDLDFGDDADDPDGVHGGAGPIPVVRWAEDDLVPLQRGFRAGCDAVGWAWASDLNRPGASGVGPLPMNRDGDLRVSTALAYLAPATGRSNLTVRGDAHVDRVLFGAGGRAVGVEVVGPDGPEVVDAGEVVLSAGSILSPALLWRSGIGPADRLRALGITCLADNPAVGANLTDHPGVFLFARPAGDAGATYPQYQLGCRYSSTAGTPDDMFLSMMNTFDLSAAPELAAAVGGPAALVVTCGVHEPRSRGSVSLRSADPLAPPRIDLGLLADPFDVTRLVEGLRRCRDVLHAGLGPYSAGIAVLDEDAFTGPGSSAVLADYVRSVVAAWYHPVGTCRMGPGDVAGTVVGDDLAVHGVTGLRVVDASIMPAICKAPTNLTTIAIAERAAELLV